MNEIFKLIEDQIKDDNFLNNSPQNSNQKLCDIRASFEKYNLISGLHTFMSQNNKSFENILPPLRLLTVFEKNEFHNYALLNFHNL